MLIFLSVWTSCDNYVMVPRRDLSLIYIHIFNSNIRFEKHNLKRAISNIQASTKGKKLYILYSRCIFNGNLKQIHAIFCLILSISRFTPIQNLLLSCRFYSSIGHIVPIIYSFVDLSWEQFEIIRVFLRVEGCYKNICNDSRRFLVDEHVYNTKVEKVILRSTSPSCYISECKPHIYELKYPLTNSAG